MLDKLARHALIVCMAVPLGAMAAPGVGEDYPTNTGFKSTGRQAALGRQQTRGADLVITAMNFLDLPYRTGGQSLDAGFDCSGFTRHVFGQTLGFSLPRRVDEQAHAPGLRPVRREQLQAGDLVFFNTLRRTFSHVGIYVGDDRFIHAPRPGATVRLENLGAGYWSSRFTGGRRAEVTEANP